MWAASAVIRAKAARTSCREKGKYAEQEKENFNACKDAHDFTSCNCADRCGHGGRHGRLWFGICCTTPDPHTASNPPTDSNTHTCSNTHTDSNTRTDSNTYTYSDTHTYSYTYPRARRHLCFSGQRRYRRTIFHSDGEWLKLCFC